MMRGILKIKNVSGGTYNVVELGGHELADDEEVDLCDDQLDTFYQDWDAAKRLTEEMTTAQLYQDIQGGDIEVVLSRPPFQ